MFIGEYQHNLDQKDRLAVPVKFRAKLKQGAVVTRGLDNCLFLYPQAGLIANQQIKYQGIQSVYAIRSNGCQC